MNFKVSFIGHPEKDDFDRVIRPLDDVIPAKGDPIYIDGDEYRVARRPFYVQEKQLTGGLREFNSACDMIAEYNGELRTYKTIPLV